MRKEVILVTGARGEIGHGLIAHLSKTSSLPILALDIQPQEDALLFSNITYIQGDILDNMLLGRLVGEYEIRTIYHLASILSTKAEFNPETAHRINVEGTLNLLRLAAEQSQWQGRSVKFIYPSSIAAYGFASLKEKEAAGRVVEHQSDFPTTMYGMNKLYCEHLGRYYSHYYKQLSADRDRFIPVDFRAIRFPGLISAATTPTGGTSDYGPEMIHAAALHKPYDCFVRPDTRIPFMVMPDAVKSLLQLESAPLESLTRQIYNVTSFSPTAMDFYQHVMEAFPAAIIHFVPDAARQGIVDTWPAYLDDSAARQDWHWIPDYDETKSYHGYLFPAIKARYGLS